MAEEVESPNGLENDPDELSRDDHDPAEDHDEGQGVVPPDKLNNDADDDGA